MESPTAMTCGACCQYDYGYYEDTEYDKSVCLIIFNGGRLPLEIKVVYLRSLGSFRAVAAGLSPLPPLYKNQLIEHPTIQPMGY